MFSYLLSGQGSFSLMPDIEHLKVMNARFYCILFKMLNFVLTCNKMTLSSVWSFWDFNFFSWHIQSCLSSGIISLHYYSLPFLSMLSSGLDIMKLNHSGWKTCDAFQILNASGIIWPVTFNVFNFAQLHGISLHIYTNWYSMNKQGTLKNLGTLSLYNFFLSEHLILQLELSWLPSLPLLFSKATRFPLVSHPHSMTWQMFLNSKY